MFKKQNEGILIKELDNEINLVYVLYKNVGNCMSFL